ncbi:hypothetical protein MFIFM68171_07261 [Madurella fahalii]|uniref:Zn(2)-C6 fungal-type domain-containing protein n=1 Tax=Madurella fahalii TaxID=1157608 RepID=A0ABQ0GH16_9PEZI
MPGSRSASAGGKRSRGGCITCKIRRVKCDETFPACVRCVQTGRTCDGYASSTSHQSRRALADAVRQLRVAGPASRVLGKPVAADDAACFDFFRHCTSAMTGSVLPAPFWECQLLQIASGERAVWKVVVALGALHRRWEYSNSRTPAAVAARQRDGPDAIARFTRQAASHYYGAISLAKEIRDPATLAVLSAALAAAAQLAGLWAECQIHLHAGLRLVQDQPDPGAVGDLVPSLERIDLQAMFFEDVRAPYAYGAVAELAYAACGPHSAWPGAELASLNEAALVVLRLVRDFMLVAGAAEHGILGLEGLLAALGRLGEDARRWEAALGRLLAGGRRRRCGEQEERTVLVMRLYHAVLMQCLTAGIIGPETRWDAGLRWFVQAVELAEEIARATPSAMPFFMSLEPGVATPLFLTVVRCRHPLVRRRALYLLGRMNRQEGIWNCGAAARVAEQCVALEEEGLGIELPLRVDDADLAGLVVDADAPVVVDADGYAPAWPGGWPNVPEKQRLLQTSLLVDLEASVIDLTMHVTGEDGLGTVTRSLSIDI